MISYVPCILSAYFLVSPSFIALERLCLVIMLFLGICAYIVLRYAATNPFHNTILFVFSETEDLGVVRECASFSCWVESPSDLFFQVDPSGNH